MKILFFLPSANWSMRGVHFLTAHRKVIILRFNRNSSLQENVFL